MDIGQRHTGMYDIYHSISYKWQYKKNTFIYETHSFIKKTHSSIHEFKFWSFIQACHLHCKMYALSNITNLIDINLFCWCKGKAKHTRQIERVNRNDNRTSRMRFRASSRGNTCIPAKERVYVRACLRACMCVCELACTGVLARLRLFKCVSVLICVCVSSSPK